MPYLVGVHEEQDKFRATLFLKNLLGCDTTQANQKMSNLDEEPIEITEDQAEPARKAGFAILDDSGEPMTEPEGVTREEAPLELAIALLQVCGGNKHNAQLIARVVGQSLSAESQVVVEAAVHILDKYTYEAQQT